MHSSHMLLSHAAVTCYCHMILSYDRYHRYHRASDIIERQKEAYLSAFINNEALSTLVLYRSLQPEYRYAHYLSVVQSFPNRRLISRFRCGCHGLHVDTAVLSTPLGMIECVKSASQDVVRTSIIFCLIVQPTLTSGTVMPPLSMAFKQFLLSSTATILVC